MTPGDVDPLSQLSVEDMIRKLMAGTQRVTIEVGQRAKDAAEADVAYKVKYAKEFLKAEGTLGIREHVATVACAEELAARKTTEALLLSAREAGMNMRARLDAARSLNTNVRGAVANPTGRGG